MWQLRDKRLNALLSRTLFLTGLIGIVTCFAFDLRGQPATKAEKAKANVKPDLMADLEELSRVLEKSDFRVFVERYGPVEMLRQVRREDAMDEAVAGLSSRPHVK